MHEPQASAIRNQDRYYILRMRHIKARSPSKCVINILLMITSPTANQVCGEVRGTRSGDGRGVLRERKGRGGR